MQIVNINSRREVAATQKTSAVKTEDEAWAGQALEPAHSNTSGWHEERRKKTKTSFAHLFHVFFLLR